ncbi:ATP-dependent RNA helicase RhlE [Thalassoglobus neptunius]|uniref:DEAD-box ATP-dependent RNA helicase RhpA n=1 Tax=Thalassoglobus neptunius TaxID=1938619 RepID=A0A5C5VB44_9PLAN|nr:DEAD/DEAH box helicase [Thalassoglobus neptunius]TWT35079.1 ATP-dependent RNA helicase RhlE [Thalassoglobus neptunius]
MTTFEELNLIPPVQRALADENYKNPTPIQAQTIPPAIAGKDVLGCAQTGTGKTASFALPILNMLGKRNRKATPNRPSALILAPTRELAIQIGDSCSKYGRHLRLRHALIYGGVGQRQQVRSLKRGVHILVATPGRLLDLMNQGHIELDQLEVFVLDEADRMMDMGFLPDLKRIIKQLPEQRQSLFFSATLSPKITELSNSLLRDPINVNVTPETTSVEKIAQQVLFVEKRDKLKTLQKILAGENVGQTLVFTKTKRQANSVAEELMDDGIRATAIHGNKSQNARQKALDAFRRKRVDVLVATDVAARGIDITGITHVINFDLPMEAENYVHRIGRTGRAGAEGIALTFCSGQEFRELRGIERLIGQEIPVDPDFPRPERRGGRHGSGGGGKGRPGGSRRHGGNRSSSSNEKSSQNGKSKRRYSSDRSVSTTSSSEGSPSGVKKKRRSKPKFPRRRRDAKPTS